ncbi:MAG: hypothetical protein IID46_10335, partial [Planctomycetes bacterium]|nr:hypothetical protein [Planctomycetota bacterium]
QKPHPCVTARKPGTRQKHQKQKEKHNWDDYVSDVNPIDFDSVYDEVRALSNLQDLFDKLVGQLEEIIACKQIDSMYAVEALEKLIATIKKNRDGSYLANAGLWGFTKAVLDKAFRNYSEQTPVLGPLIKAVFDTMDETETEIEDVQDQFFLKCNEVLPVKLFTPPALPAPADTELEVSADTQT